MMDTDNHYLLPTCFLNLSVCTVLCSWVAAVGSRISVMGLGMVGCPGGGVGRGGGEEGWRGWGVGGVRTDMYMRNTKYCLCTPTGMVGTVWASSSVLVELSPMLMM